MNKLKKSLLFCLSFVLALSFVATSFPAQKEKHTFSAPANNQLINNTLLSFVSISTDGQSLTSNEIKNIDTNSDNKPDASYVFVNRTATLNFEPLNFSYTATFNPSYFYESTEQIVIEKLASDISFPSMFTYNEIVYTYSINGENNLTITNTKTNRRFSGGDFIKYDPLTDTETTRTFTIITSYTLKSTAPNTSFSFIPRNSTANANGANQYTINFERPIVNFKTDNVTLFTCKGLDVGNTEYINNKIEKELSYENIKFQITNNDYTENNPLYFDINYNGFPYTFKLFSKLYDGTDPLYEGKELLYVEYYDLERVGNNCSLASGFDKDGNFTAIYKYYGPVEDKVFNTFSIDFNKTGRYELSIYDETYLLNLNDYNYYTTSFYIKTNDGANDDSAFDNAYAIMQSYDDEGNFLDYIVSTSTQNNNVQVTLKNLAYYFENDPVINSFIPTENTPDLKVVEFIEATLTGSLNDPVSTFYTLSQLKEMLETSPDIKFNCENDSFYKINIYQFKKDGELYKIKDTTSYQFTIAKQPKIIFTSTKVDKNYDPIPKKGEKSFETETKEADIPFKTTPVNYRININSKMEFMVFFKNPSASKTAILDKTYLNEYTINFAMQMVKMESVKVLEPGTTDSYLNVLAIKFSGIGEIKVKVTVDSSTTEYTITSGETLIFEDYGVYSVQMEDSMGTTSTSTFKFLKPVSISAIILIALVGVVVLAIVLFVISSRGKLSTR